MTPINPATGEVVVGVTATRTTTLFNVEKVVLSVSTTGTIPDAIYPAFCNKVSPRCILAGNQAFISV